MIAAGILATPACSSSSSSTSPSSPLACTSSTVAGAQVDVLSTETSNGSRVDITRTASADGGVHETFVLTRSGSPFAQGSFTHAADGTLAAKVDYDGEAVHEVVLGGADGQPISLWLDGRAVPPMTLDQMKADPAGIRFADGTALPAYRDAAMGPDLQTLFQQMGKSFGQCGTTAGQGVSIASVPGHKDDFTSECDNCKGVCVGVFYGCITGVAAGCSALAAIPFIGWALALACDGVGDLACGVALVACKDACEHTGGACCPVACGNGCCASSETCLDTALGTCCTAGTLPCLGPNPSCYDPKTEKCLPTGQGCPIGNNSCGSTCCAAGEGACTQSGECCAQEKLCGANCCGPFSTCIDAAAGTCCEPKQACGKNCCAPGTTCTGLVGQQECCPAERACGETCCGAGQFCNAGTCSACAPGESACQAPNGPAMCCPNGVTCDATQCCPSGETYCALFGDCRAPAACILP
ncbi:MAG TPA: hypothetical protein VF765_06440 [Polyangiaceae bacterium]